MDQTLPLPPELPDRQTFERVWNKVMPAGTPLPPNAGPETPILQQLMDLAATRATALLTLSRRKSRFAHPLSAMAADCRKEFCQLAALWFICFGSSCRPAVSAPALPPSLAHAIRAQYLSARAWADLCQVGEACSDALTASLCSSLRQEGEGHAAALRAMLEQLCTFP